MQHSIILFDGVCNLCSGTVQFVFRRDTRQQFRFASLQSEVGRRLMRTHHLPESSLESVILIEDGKAYRQSTAALRIAKKLNAAWPLLYAFIVVPRPIRDMVYNFIGRNRYQWFGRTQTCWVPDGPLSERFLPEDPD